MNDRIDPNLAAVYEALTGYQVNGTRDWDLHRVITQLHDWAETFRVQFKLEIPSVPVRLARLRWNCLGHFNPGFNDFGLTNEIAIDIMHLSYRVKTACWWQVLGTLLHEQLHFWQQLHGQPAKPGPGNYHNVQYRDRAIRLGLLVSSRGVNEGYDPDGPFLKLLAERGIVDPEIVRQQQGTHARVRIGSKLKKWTCGCRRAVRVAVADFNARCLDCNSIFQRAN